MPANLLDLRRFFAKRKVAKPTAGNRPRRHRRLGGCEPLEPRWFLSGSSAAAAAPEVWLPLDEGAGNVAADYSGNGRNATVFGATWTPGRSGSALSFDGQSGYVNANLDLSRWLGGTGALSFWLMTTQAGSGSFAAAPGIAGVHQPDSNNEIGWGWLDAAGHLHVGAGVTAVSTHVVNDGQWHFIAMSRNATSGSEQVFVDGALDGSAVGKTGGITSAFTSVGRIENGAGSGVYFAGQLDDIQIYSQTLAAAQVQRAFQQGPAAHGASPPSPAVSKDGWTQQENARIDQIRKGNAEVHVVDQFGNPVANVTIDARQVQSQFPFGSAINNNVVVNPQYAAFFKSHFSWAAMEDESTWYANEPTQGNVTYTVADAIAAYAKANNITLRGPALFWGDDSIIQPWLKQLSPTELFKAVQSRLQSAVSHFDGTFAQWTVDNEMLHAHFFENRLTSWVLPWMFQQVRALDPDVQLFVNDYNTIEGTDTAAYKAEIQSLEAKGAPIDGIGVQGHFFAPVNPRDVESRLNSLGQLGLPIWITEFDTVNSDPNQRANQMEALYREAFSNPNVHGILMWGFWAGSQWRGPNAAMVNLDWTLNADGQRYDDLMHQWATIADGATSGAGNLDFRGFAGTYDITVVGPDGLTTVQRVTLNPGATTNQFTIAIHLTAPSAATNVMATGGDGRVSLTWAAAAGAANYNILRGPTSGGEGSVPIRSGVPATSFIDTSAVNGVTYYYQIVAVNGAGASLASTEAVATAQAPVGLTQAPVSLWTNATQPRWINTFDTQPVELGMKFQSDVDGFITSLRFFKPPTSTGPHVAHLWAADGTLLATATFTNETKSGWQQVNFAQPVAIKAHTTYIASYHTNHGNYADDVGFFAGKGMDHGVLHGLAEGVDGSNGVFQYGPGGFPNSSWRSSNYWVDVVFVSSG